MRLALEFENNYYAQIRRHYQSWAATIKMRTAFILIDAPYNRLHQSPITIFASSSSSLSNRLRSPSR
jgi:hypothetical protein